MKATMKTHFLKAACLAAAVTLMASQANAVDLTIVSVNESLSIVDVQNSINLSASSTNLAGATTTASGGGFSGTLTSSYADMSGLFDPKFIFDIPVTPGGNADTLIRATSTVLFTANQNHRLASIGVDAGSSGISGSIEGVGVVFSAQTDVFVVSELFDLTSNEVVSRTAWAHGDPLRTIDGVDPGPNVDIDFFAAIAEDAVFLRMGHEYSFTLEVEARTEFLVPSDFGLVFNDDALSGSGGHEIGFAITAVPEPETYALMLAGLGLVGFMAKRRKAL